MRKIILYSVVLLSAILLSHKTEAQVFANVELNRKSVYVQQPFHVTITVYTKTWFTAPLQFGNLQIPNAFIVPFDNTQPGMFTVGGTQYPGIQFYYIVFPYKTGDFTVPSLEITAQSPPEGSSQAQKIVLQTKPQPFQVKDIPAEPKKKGAWFVAKDVIMKEEWTPALKDLKTGDVVKRTLTIDAKGTLPQFIPELSKQEELKWASSYPQDPVLTDTRGNGDANGKSVQTTTYLLEKAGDFTVQGIQLSFWNPYTAKIETRTTPSITVHIKENANLGILTTLKDSLSATAKPQTIEKTEKKPFLILGMKWYQFVGIAIIGILILNILFKFGRKLFKSIRVKRENYKNSEDYLFKKFQKANHDPKSFLNALYQWWDSFRGESSASVNKTINNESLNSYFEKVLHNENPDDSEIKKDLKAYRKKKDTKNDQNSIFP